MMAVFSERHTGYKVGVVLFCIGLVAFIVGFASPYWTTSEGFYKGLWETCLKGDYWLYAQRSVGDLPERRLLALRGSTCTSLAGGEAQKGMKFLVFR